jgi:regulator of sigma E protease
MTLLAFLLAIVVLVVFHELGHYAVARWCGVKVLRFSVGFGKVIFSKRFVGGETEWVLSAIPLGGYVKMLDEREGEVAPEELPRTFNRQSVARRMAIVVAGPMANLLLAIALYWLLFMVGVPGVKPILGTIPAATPAAAAQLHTQQTLISINGQPTPTWQEVRWNLLDLVLQKQSASLELRNPDGQTVTRFLDTGTLTAADLDGDFLEKLGLHPYQPPLLPIIEKLSPDGAAERGGLLAQDKILRVNQQPITVWDDFVTQVRTHPNLPLTIEVNRGNSLIILTISPDAVNESGQSIGRIGAAPVFDRTAFEAMLTTVSYPALAALQHAISKTWDTAIVSLKMMGKMLVGEVSLKNLSGPITIADYAGQSAELGWVSYLSFLALISISLGVLNLLPIPLLDGGHLLYYSLEWIQGRPVSEKTWEIGQKIGIALLVTMMAFAFYNDISRLISG